jgi:WD40 repeat protein
VRRIADALMVEQRIVGYSPHVQTQSTKALLDTFDDEGDAEEGVCQAGIEVEPIRVLDAPGLVDDFYLNVLHWSPHYQDRSFLAVGLGEKIWSYDMHTARATCMATLHSPAASVAWNPEIASVAIGTKDGTVLYQRSARRVHGGRAGVLAWRDGQVLATAGKDAHVMLHDFRTAEPVTVRRRVAGRP